MSGPRPFRATIPAGPAGAAAPAGVAIPAAAAAVRALGLIALAIAVPACRDREPPPPAVARDNVPARRVIIPAVGDVRPLPPHAIRADGVGPYKLGAPLDSILAQLPSGPRVALLDLQGVVDVSIVRAEDDAVLVGGESVGASAAYVAVVRPDIARTESGIGVGSTRAELDAALGPVLADPRVARDPRLAAYASLPGARFVIADDRVTGVLLRRREGSNGSGGENGGHGDARGHEPGSGDAGCGEGPRRDPAIAASGLRGQLPRAVMICLGAGGELVVTAGDSLVLVAGEGERIRKVASADIPGLRFAAPVRIDGARDELVTVAERPGDGHRVITVALYRLDGGKLVRSAEQEVYRIAATSAGWIGARLADLDLLLEIDARPDALVVAGAFVHRQQGLIRDLAPLESVRVPRRRKPTPAEPGSDVGAGASVRDAGVVDAAPVLDATP